MKAVVKTSDQSQQIRPDQSTKGTATKKLACHNEETQTKKQRYTDETSQTKTTRYETVSSQTLDSGIDTDDEDVPKEFKNVKKAALAKKIGNQRDEIKALNDQIKMQQEQIRELTKANDEKDGLLTTKQVYIDKLQERVADLKKAHGIK